MRKEKEKEEKNTVLFYNRKKKYERREVQSKFGNILSLADRNKFSPPPSNFQGILFCFGGFFFLYVPPTPPPQIEEKRGERHESPLCFRNSTLLPPHPTPKNPVIVFLWQFAHIHTHTHT